MKMDVTWSMFLAANSRAKCEKLLEKIQNLDLNFRLVGIEPYFKDKSLYKIKGESQFEAPSVNDGYYSIMSKASSLARSWSVTVPENSDEWDFSGASNPGSIRIPGVESISFEASGRSMASP